MKLFSWWGFGSEVQHWPGVSGTRFKKPAMILECAFELIFFKFNLNYSLKFER